MRPQVIEYLPLDKMIVKTYFIFDVMRSQHLTYTLTLFRNADRSTV